MLLKTMEYETKFFDKRFTKENQLAITHFYRNRKKDKRTIDMYILLENIRDVLREETDENYIKAITYFIEHELLHIIFDDIGVDNEYEDKVIYDISKKPDVFIPIFNLSLEVWRRKQDD